MTVRLRTDGDVGELVLDRPEKLNAFDPPMVAALGQCLDEAESAGLRALLVRGEGRGFCAGRDLASADPDENATELLSQVFNPLVRRLAAFPAPTVAAVHGACLGFGLGLALACDIVHIADDATIGSPFARTGGVLDCGGHHFLTRRMGSHRALELVYTARLLTGREAADWGLVNRSLGADDLVTTCRQLVHDLAAGPTTALVQSKAIIRRIEVDGIGLDEVLNAEAVAQGAASRTDDYREGIEAFVAKRPPRFSGR